MKAQNNHKDFLIPEKVLQNFEAINSFVREKKITGFNTDNLKEVISIVAIHERKDETTTPLKMTYIKFLVPNGDRYLLVLIEMGVIIRSGAYVPGVKSYRYDFSPDYKSRYVSAPLTDMRLIRRLNEVQTQFERQGSKLVRGYCNQVQYLKKLTLADGYDKYINENYSTETKKDTEKYNAIIASATRIKNGVFKWKIDQTSGRFHSNVTNMNKDLRPFLRVDEKPLCNIDIKNSQPFLSTILLTNPGKVSWMTKNPAFALLLESLKVSMNLDVKNYISLVVSGGIYEHLMAEFAKEGLVLTRKETKVQMLRILFARNRSPKDETNKKCRAIFKDRFPTVHRIFAKVRGNETGDKFTSFSRFAILLQRIESYLILDRILKRVYRELPGVVAITIHDSVMTGVLTSDVEAVRKIMLEEMTDFVGFEPQISIEGITKEEEGINRQAVTLTNTMHKPLQLTDYIQLN
jgi:hypothetical protein